MKKSKAWWVVAVWLLVLGSLWLMIREVGKWNNDDYKIAFMEDSGIMIRSISWKRGMVNELWVDGQVSVWVPKGMGWYQSDKIGRLLDQERKEYLAGKVMFYNFGFVPDMVILDKDDNWLTDTEIVKNWGIVNYFRFLISRSRMMTKRESIDSELVNATELLNEVIQRDFADSRILGEDLKIAIYNVGDSQGLAGFMSKILEWSGFFVMGVDNYAGDKATSCKISYGNLAGDTYGFEIIKEEFDDCRFEENQRLDGMGIEFYFGDSYSKMLNYSSYLEKVNGEN